MYKVEVKYTDNSNKFRQPALNFQKNGYYCPHPRGTSAYMEYWDTETIRCLEGFATEDGEWISGYNYFYLNYSPILIVTAAEGSKIGKRVRDFATYWDYDRAFFDAVEEAEKEGKHLTFLKPRGVGASFKGSSMLARNYFLIPESTSLAITEETESLTKDGILTKAWDIVDFINEHTAWSKKSQKINTKLHRRASIVVDNGTTQLEIGYKSEIIGLSVKNNPDKPRGKRFKLAIVDEIGMVASPKHLYSVMRHGAEEDGTAYGLIILQGTGGSEGADYSEMRRLYYEPDVNNFLEVENIWDEGSYGKSCGFFWPKYYNMRGHMDAQGNSNIISAKAAEEELRQHIIANASDRSQIDRHCSERPFCPQEALLEVSANIFPKKELLNHLTYIRTHDKVKNFKQTGDLLFDSVGGLKWEQSKKPKDITEYRLKKEDNREGQIVIWEHPADNPPYGLYILACLPPGEKVMTDIGLMNIEDVGYDRMLINKDGKLVSIDKLLRYDVKNEDTYNVTMSNTYRKTTFTKEHPILVSKQNSNYTQCVDETRFDFEFKKASEIEVGDWVKVPNIYNSKETDYNRWFNESYRIDRQIDNPLNNPDFWWFVGLWLGDGWCGSDGYSISIAFNSKEQQYIDKLIGVVDSLFNRKVTITKAIGNGLNCVFSFQQLNSFLTDNFGKYTYGKYIPEWFKYYDELYKQQLILGYLDSDGYIGKHSGGYYQTEFVSINQELLESVQDILFSIGVVSNITLMRGAQQHTFSGNRTCNTKPCYHLRLGHHDTVNLCNQLNQQNNIKISRIDLQNLPVVRKRAKDGCFISSDRKYIYFKIRDIEKSTYTGTVYNFECETHTFMCHHITTHNCDPYDMDQANSSTSLGSCFVYKRFQSFEKNYDMIVAEYTGRPEMAEDFYENVRKLAIYYNGKILYENEKKGLFIHFAHKHCEYLLADQPNIIKDIIQDSKVQRGKGIHMNKQIKQFGELRVKEWLNEEYEPGKKNLTKILSEALLEELIEYNPDGNFDRVIAFSLIMIYREELYHYNVDKIIKREVKKELFPDGLFRHNMSGYKDKINTFSSVQAIAPWGK